MITLHHVGVVVSSIEDAADLYCDTLGLKSEGIYESYGMKKVFLHSEGPSALVLLLMEPSQSEDRFGRFLRDKGEGLFHLSFFTNTYDDDLQAIKEKGFSVDEEGPYTLPEKDSVRAAWLQPRETRGVWIELVDSTGFPL